MTTVEYKISNKELLEIYIKTVLPGFLLKLLGIIFLFKLLVQLVKIYSEVNIGLSGLIIAFPASIFIVVWETLLIWIPGTLIAFVILVGIFWFRLRTRNLTIDAPIKFGFSEDGLISETNLTKSEFKWDYIKRVRIFKNYYLLQTKLLANISAVLPKRAFSNEQKEKLEEMLKKKKVLVTK